MTTTRLFILIASCFAFLAVAAGAFGAHGLKQRLTLEMLDVFEVGARYQMYHALALLAVAWLCPTASNPRLATIAGWFFVAGILLFSGSLYLLALTGVRWLGAITPIGGVAFLAGWLLLALSAWKA